MRDGRSDSEVQAELERALGALPMAEQLGDPRELIRTQAIIATYEWVLGRRSLPIRGGTQILDCPTDENNTIMKAWFAGQDAQQGLRLPWYREDPSALIWDGAMGAAVEWARGFGNRGPALCTDHLRQTA